MKNVLVLIHDDAGQEARLQAALDVVRNLDGHLACLEVAGISLEQAYPGPEAAVKIVEREMEGDAANRAADAQATVAGGGSSTIWWIAGIIVLALLAYFFTR